MLIYPKLHSKSCDYLYKQLSKNCVENVIKQVVYSSAVYSSRYEALRNFRKHSRSQSCLRHNLEQLVATYISFVLSKLPVCFISLEINETTVNQRRMGDMEAIVQTLKFTCFFFFFVTPILLLLNYNIFSFQVDCIKYSRLTRYTFDKMIVKSKRWFNCPFGKFQFLKNVMEP